MPPEGALTAPSAGPSTGEAGGPEATFEPHRKRLTGLAYRMLGSLADAQDVVQDAFLRWHASDRSDIGNAGAYLSRIVTRLALDHLKSARVQRETYVGPWLPEPIVEGSLDVEIDEYSHDLSFAMMLALERLSPLERAAFLLHDVFDTSFAEVASILDRSEPACRQLAARARAQVKRRRPRFRASDDAARSLTSAFLEASRTGDTATLGRLLAEDVVCHTDGGGKRLAALNIVVGREKIERFYRARAQKQTRTAGEARFVRVNGMPGFVTIEPDGMPQVTALDIADGRITTIYVVRNPDKLRHIAG